MSIACNPTRKQRNLETVVALTRHTTAADRVEFDRAHTDFISCITTFSVC